MKVLYLRVAKKDGERVRKKLMEEYLIDRRRKIQPDGGFLLIPVLKGAAFPGAELMELEEDEPFAEGPKSLHEALTGKLSADELSILPRAFDLIGDIAVLDIPPGLEDKKALVGETLLSVFPQIKVAARKVSAVGSEFRTRRIEVLAGENRKETTHREYGCSYRLDVETSYFSPRLGTERMRVASQVREGERVLVLFAGIGPYAILIAKKAPSSEVVAVELNPEAVDYMRWNVALNKVKVEVVLGDAKEEARKHGVFDRIIMPLPKDAADFLESSLPALKKGGLVHFYDFSPGGGASAKRVRDICEKLGYEVEVLDEVICGSYSPDIHRVCVDFKLV